MLGYVLRAAGVAHLVLAALVLAIVLTPPSARLYGDRLQVALPVIAWGCAAANRTGREFALRFAAMFTIAHGSKQLLGEAELNQRPNGRPEGFPSAHTSAAAIGASSLVHDCIQGHPLIRGAVIMAGAYVGASRIEADKHTIWQVLAGGLLGWGCDRALRRDSPARRRVIRALEAAGRGVRGQWRWLVEQGRRPVRQAFAAMATLFLAVTARAETELSVYGGIQTAPHSTIDHSALGEDFVTWEGKSFEMPPYWGIRATWWQSETFGWGLEFNHAKIYADDPARYGYEVLEMTDGINFLTANVWRRWPGEGRLTPYVGAGLGVAIPHVEVQPAGEELTFEYQVTGPAVQIVGGLSWEIDEKWSVFGEYKGTWSSHRMDLDSGGTLETEIITNALNLGLSFRF